MLNSRVFDSNNLFSLFVTIEMQKVTNKFVCLFNVNYTQVQEITIKGGNLLNIVTIFA